MFPANVFVDNRDRLSDNRQNSILFVVLAADGANFIHKILFRARKKYDFC